jgi:hypothetical protein
VTQDCERGNGKGRLMRRRGVFGLVPAVDEAVFAELVDVEGHGGPVRAVDHLQGGLGLRV